MAIRLGPYTLEFYHFLAKAPDVLPYPRFLAEERTEMDVHFLWDDAPVPYDETRNASWFLARVWKITDGELLKGLNVDPQTLKGSQDGASFFAGCAILDQDEHVIGILELGGNDTWYYLTLQECSIEHDPNVLTETIYSWFWEAPDDIAVCKIEMYDFERQDQLFYFGWDGERFY